jgi:peroxiredoxin Q/BCP
MKARKIAKKQKKPAKSKAFSSKNKEGSSENKNKLKEGQKAPGFALQDFASKTYRLSDFLGKIVVLYFYPKDDTPGCTIEACDFSSNLGKFEEAGAVVIGISPDGKDSHSKFAAKYNLRHLLLCDPGHKAADAYGVWAEKKFMGRKFSAIKRSTFIIDKSGNIAKALYGVNPIGHAEHILKLVMQISQK